MGRHDLHKNTKIGMTSLQQNKTRLHFSQKTLYIKLKHFFETQEVGK